MKIMAIDPGAEQSGFVMWDTEKDNFFIPKGNAWISRGHGRPEWKKMGLFDNWKVENIILDIAPLILDLIAIEMIQAYGLTVGRTTFKTAVQVGRFAGFLAMHNYSARLYGRPTIKGQIGGKTDAQIRASLRMRYGEARKGEKLEGVKKDIWSALALAAALTENPNLKEW